MKMFFATAVIACTAALTVQASAKGPKVGSGAGISSSSHMMPARSNKGGAVRGRARARQVHKMNSMKR